MVPPIKREHFDSGWDALFALGKFVLQTQGLNAFLLMCLLGWSIYSDWRYNDRAEARTERIEKATSVLDAKFDVANAAMSAAANDRKRAAETLETIRQNQNDDRRDFEKFQREIKPVIEAVRVLLERIEREAASSEQRTRRGEGGEETEIQYGAAVRSWERNQADQGRLHPVRAGIPKGP